MFLPGEVSQVLRSKPYAKRSIVTTNCEKSAEVIVPNKWEGPNNSSFRNRKEVK